MTLQLPHKFSPLMASSTVSSCCCTESSSGLSFPTRWPAPTLLLRGLKPIKPSHLHISSPATAGRKPLSGEKLSALLSIFKVTEWQKVYLIKSRVVYNVCSSELRAPRLELTFSWHVIAWNFGISVYWAPSPLVIRHCPDFCFLKHYLLLPRSVCML